MSHLAKIHHLWTRFGKVCVGLVGLPLSARMVMQAGFLTALVLTILPAGQASEQADFDHASLSELEQRRDEIQAELTGLARISLRSGMGAAGVRSRSFPTAEDKCSLQVDLGGSYPIDMVVLSPVLWRERQSDKVLSDGFPEAFRVLIGEGADTEGVVVAEVTSADRILPRIAPVSVSFPVRTGSWLRVEPTRLGRRIEDGRYVFELSELMVFSGGENVALRQRIHFPNKLSEEKYSQFHETYVTDGMTPYYMDAADEVRSLPYISRNGVLPDVLMDLGEPRRFSRIRLHGVGQSNVIPQSFVDDLGIPRRFRIDGSDTPDFTNARVLLDYRWGSLYQLGPMMEWEIPETTCRYIRLRVVKGNSALGIPGGRSCVGFAEIELLDGAKNVAKDCKVGIDGWSAGGRADRSYGDPSAMVDGRNMFGLILSLRDWMEQLARRHDLERDLKQIEGLLPDRYAKQKRALLRMKQIATGLLILIVLLVLIAYLLRIRNEARIRERISANLHDELGANLHAIGALGDLAEEAIDHREELVDTLEQIRALTRRTGLAAGRCASMMSVQGLCDDLAVELRDEAKRLLRDFDYTVTIEDEAALNELSRRRRLDLLLFFKECLVNVLRHSRAQSVRITVHADRRVLWLKVMDDGVGLGSLQPKALKRRARFLHAQLRLEPNVDKRGLCVTLAVQRKRWGMIR